MVVWGLNIQCHKSLFTTDGRKFKQNMSDEDLEPLINWIISSASHFKGFFNESQKSLKVTAIQAQICNSFQLVLSGPSIERDTVSVRGLTVNSYKLNEKLSVFTKQFLGPYG